MKYLLFLVICLSTQFAFAQISTRDAGLDTKVNQKLENPVTWDFKIEKNGSRAIITAKALILGGWHLFTSTPGGDGSLIPTEMEVYEIKKNSLVHQFVEEGSVVSREIEGIGLVNFYEHEVVYKYLVDSKNLKTFTGTVTYQVCNDSLCLAPTQIPFSLTLK